MLCDFTSLIQIRGLAADVIASPRMTYGASGR